MGQDSSKEENYSKYIHSDFSSSSSDADDSDEDDKDDGGDDDVSSLVSDEIEEDTSDSSNPANSSEHNNNGIRIMVISATQTIRCHGSKKVRFCNRHEVKFFERPDQSAHSLLYYGAHELQELIYE